MELRKGMDVYNQRFSRLVALHPTEEYRNKSRLWRCMCDCGNEPFVTVSALKSGNTRS